MPDELYPKVEKKIKGPKWFIIIFIIVMIGWAIAEFFGPILGSIMKSLSGK